MSKERSMEQEDSHGLMVALTMDSLWRIIFKVKVNIIGLTAENTMDYGSITRWKEVEFSLGLMEEDTKVIMLMIKRKVMVFSTGQMVENMKEDGKMVNNMESEHILVLVEKPNKENGKMERDFNGFHNDYSLKIIHFEINNLILNNF